MKTITYKGQRYRIAGGNISGLLVDLPEKHVLGYVSRKEIPWNELTLKQLVAIHESDRVFHVDVKQGYHWCHFRQTESPWGEGEYPPQEKIQYPPRQKFGGLASRIFSFEE